MKKALIKTINFDNEKFYIYDTMPQWWNFVDGASELPGLWERFVSRTVIDNIKSDWNFADIGASFGAYTLLAAKRTNGMCYAFEPNSMNFHLLTANVSRFDNVKCINKALGDKDIQKDLNLSVPGAGGHSLVFQRSGKTEPVKVIVLDSLNLHIDMMKIDAEGYGHKILKGAEKTLNDTKLVIFELHSGEDAVIKLLKSKGFNRFVFSKGKSFTAFRNE